MTIYQKQTDGTFIPFNRNDFLIIKGREYKPDYDKLRKNLGDPVKAVAIAKEHGLYKPALVDIKPTYDPATQRLGTPTETITETTITRTFPIVFLIIQEKIDYIKNKANQDIVNIMPEYKQRNNLAKAVEILLKVVTQGYTPTPTESLEIQNGTTLWLQIKAIRDKSNVDEANLLI